MSAMLQVAASLSLASRRAASAAHRPRRLFVERLEDRQLLACVAGQTTPCVEDPNLAVRTVVGGLDQPTTMAFLAANDFLVLEKASGQVKHVVNGAVVGTAARSGRQ